MAKDASKSPSIRPIDILRFAGSKPLAFEPGSQWSYSNTNYIALGLVIEQVTGRSYADALERRIFQPLELDATELPQTRRLPDLDDGGFDPNSALAAGGDRLQRARPVPLPFRAPVRADPVRQLPRSDEEDGRCRPWWCVRPRARLDRCPVRTRVGPWRRHPRLHDARLSQATGASVSASSRSTDGRQTSSRTRAHSCVPTTDSQRPRQRSTSPSSDEAASTQ